MTRQELLRDYDPDGVGLNNAGIYGLPFGLSQARVVIIPMPWDVTVSYRAGTNKGPQAIRAASPQLDLYENDIDRAWELGLYLHTGEFSDGLHERSRSLRQHAELIIDDLENGLDAATRHAAEYELVNGGCAQMIDDLQAEAGRLLDEEKIVAVLGGDHSTPLGLMRALAARHDEFAILQIDAHADLRRAYEGFEYSHASIMYNALQLPQITTLTQVGVRDLCDAEAQLAQRDARIHLFGMRELQSQQFGGTAWAEQCRRIIDTLPAKVYISFDIDGLDPALCPNTGTPVPGGLGFAEAMYLIEQAVRSGRKIIGFDLVEVAPGPNADEWDANVGARVLYRMANLCGVSQGMLQFRE